MTMTECEIISKIMFKIIYTNNFAFCHLKLIILLIMSHSVIDMNFQLNVVDLKQSSFISLQQFSNLYHDHIVFIQFVLKILHGIKKRQIFLERDCRRRFCDTRRE